MINAQLPPPMEFEVHCQIADLLAVAISPGWSWFHVPNGEKRDKATAARLKRMGVKPGISDFLLIAPEGARLHALELKRQGKKPTDEQYVFMDAVFMAGGQSTWVDNFDDALIELKRWGAIRVTA